MKKASCLVSILLVAACGGGAGTVTKDAHAPAAKPAVQSCAFDSAARPIGRTGSSSTLALARIDGRRVAFVADEDARALLTVDIDTKDTIAETRLEGTPAHVYVANDGRVFVTLRDKNEVIALSASHANAPLATRCTQSTAAEPIAMAATRDDALLVVTAGWGQELAAFDTKDLSKTMSTKLPREPRSVVLSDDGKTAFVSHAVGSNMSVVDLAKHEAKTVSLHGIVPGSEKSLAQRKKIANDMMATDPVTAKSILGDVEAEQKKLRDGSPSCQGFALAKSEALPGRIFAPQVMVDPGDPERRPDGYGDENQITEQPAVAVVDEGAREPLAASVAVNTQLHFIKRGRSGDQRDPRPDCLLPRAAAIDPSTKSLLVTCYGIDAVVAYDGANVSPLTAERRRWTVGSGPSGIVIDTEKHRGVVWSQFDRTIATFPIGGTELADDKTSPPLVVRTAMPALREKLPAEYALGRIIFHAAGDMRISSDGRACASCHPDGRDDAITWATPEGPRRSIMLAGRVAKTPPYSWNGTETSIPNHLGNTFDRLSGKGLRSIELDALVAYLAAMPAPPQPTSIDRQKADRGKQIFTSVEAGCSTCHAGATFTDGRNHDVGSKHKADRTAQFNTPSLHLVGGTGPYFHDGRYATLSELLEKSDGKMGKTKHLSKNDLDALETYLRTL